VTPGGSALHKHIGVLVGVVIHHVCTVVLQLHWPLEPLVGAILRKVEHRQACGSGPEEGEPCIIEVLRGCWQLCRQTKHNRGEQHPQSRYRAQGVSPRAQVERPGLKVGAPPRAPGDNGHDVHHVEGNCAQGDDGAERCDTSQHGQSKEEGGHSHAPDSGCWGMRPGVYLNPYNTEWHRPVTAVAEQETATAAAHQKVCRISVCQSVWHDPAV